jgi:hypothetical protein
VTERSTRDDGSHAALEAFRARHTEVRDPGSLAAGPAARVARLDRPGVYFLLVPIHDAGGLRGIVQLDGQGGAVESSAAIRDPASAFLVTADAAVSAARQALPRARDWRQPFLGWRACHESFDSMRPLWVVPHADGEAFVTQSLQVFEALTSGRGG